MASHLINSFTRLFPNLAFHAILEPSTSKVDPINVPLSTENRSDTPYEVVSYDRSKNMDPAKHALTM